MKIRNRYGALILAGIFFGSTGTAQALGPKDISPMAVGSARLLCGAFLLWLFTRFMPRTIQKLDKRDLWLAAIGMALYQLAFFAAVKSTGVSIGTVTALGSAPALTGIIAFILTREKPSRSWLIATSITTVGIFALSSNKGFSQFNLLGFTLAICAGASYSLFAVASKRALAMGVGIAEAMTQIFILSAILDLPFLFAAGSSRLISPHGFLLVLWLGLVPTALAYLAYAYGLHGVRASTASTLILAEPATATLLAAAILHEHINAQGWIGIAIIAIGLLYLSRE
ncbi:MAG: EamA family transporter [Streptomycetaceae bacterium]|nr:MAG: EamA family transporter [Streptomycetaceae bacterium]